MPCETTRSRPNQTFTERKEEVRSAITALSAALAAGRAKVVVNKANGAVAFQGWQEGRNARVTDSCAFRLILSTGSALAKQAIARAEQLAGRAVSREALKQGIHGHEDGHGHLHWHSGH